MKTALMVAVSIAGLAASVLAGLAVLSAIGSARMRGLYGVEKTDLTARARTVSASPQEPSARDRRPAPVRHSLAKRGGLGAGGIKLAVLRQRGTFRTGPARPWMSFEAEQIYSLEPPAFLWLAQARAVPGFSIWVRDKYADGRGNMLIRPLGLFTLADAVGPELDQGAALRYWSEILLFPRIALTPRVSWREINDRVAGVTFEHAGLTVNGVVEFDGQGDMTEFRADRYQSVGDRFVLMGWSGLMRNWKIVDGMPIPAHWEAVWHQPDGDFTHIRMDILSVQTE